MARWRHFGHNCMCHRSRTLFSRPNRMQMNVTYRSKDFAGACCHSPLSCAHVMREKKEAGVVSKEKATRVLSEAKEFVCSEREKEEKANLIKLMQQRTNRADHKHISPNSISLSLSAVCARVRACVLLALFVSCQREREAPPLLSH